MRLIAASGSGKERVYMNNFFDSLVLLAQSRSIKEVTFDAVIMELLELCKDHLGFPENLWKKQPVP